MPVLPDGDAPAPPLSDLTPWVPADELNCSPCDVDPEVIAQAATIIADNLSGHQFGWRQMRLRPMAIIPSCGCAGYCGCGRVSEVHLGVAVSAVGLVRVDGSALASDDWVFYGDSRLVRTDGGTFPCCQRLAGDPLEDDGTFEIAATVGAAPDAMAVLAVQEIACELVNALDNPSACRLPKRVQSLTRQQLSVSFTDPTQVLTDGFTGLPLTDLWLGSLDAISLRKGGRAVDLSRQDAWRAPA